MILANTKLKRISELSDDGNNRKTAKYQKKICNNKGMFLKISIYASATFEAKILVDRRVIPTKKPITVAKKIPIPETKRVLSSPTK